MLAVWLPDREYDLTALAGGDEAVNTFVAAETYHRQADPGGRPVIGKQLRVLSAFKQAPSVLY